MAAAMLGAAAMRQQLSTGGTEAQRRCGESPRDPGEDGESWSKLCLLSRLRSPPAHVLMWHTDADTDSET